MDHGHGHEFHGHGAAVEIPCPMKEICCHSILLGELYDHNLLVSLSFSYVCQGVILLSFQPDIWLSYFFQRGKLCPNRRVFNFLMFYGLNPQQLTQEKQKSSVDQGFTGCVNIFLLECIVQHHDQGISFIQ